MAEFCVDCFNKMNCSSIKEKNLVLSGEAELCEGCGKYKRTVVCLRPGLLSRLKQVLSFFG